MLNMFSQLGCVAVVISLQAMAVEPSTQPTSRPAQDTGRDAKDVPARAEPASAEELLDHLEQTAQELQSLTGEIHYFKIDGAFGGEEIRQGSLLYEEQDSTRRFAIMFDTLIDRDRLQQRSQHFVFDGRSFAEIDHKNKQFIKRQVSRDGEAIDPLKLGEGPIPLPIGQSKAEVLARFEATLIDRPTHERLKSLKDDVFGLLLIPRENTPESKDFSRVELFYDRETFLPIGVVAISVPRGTADPDQKVVHLKNVQRNPALTDAQRALMSTEPPDPREWEISIEELRAAGD